MLMLTNQLIVTNAPINVGVLECTLDPLAERLLIIARTGKFVAMRRAKTQLNVIVPLEYTVSNNLMCILLDDDGEKDGELVDNVKATAIDIKTYAPTL